ncbi:hypothetical protein ACFL59_01325 [Planctomycetota bacterium]
MAARKTVGFDRDIQLEWLDATATWASHGLSLAEIRTNLDNLLEGKVKRTGQRSARDKTMTVLLHVWVQIPDFLTALRDEGLRVLPMRTRSERLALHWGMCIATYPFFRDVVAVIGRLHGLQGSVALTHITRRATEAWGERSTVIRAARRIARSLVRWGVLTETGERGVYAPAPRIAIRDGDELGPWLAEAGLSNCERQARPLRSLLSSPELFPFSLRVSPRQLSTRRGVEVHRQGLDEDIVVLNAGTA